MISGKTAVRIRALRVHWATWQEMDVNPPKRVNEKGSRKQERAIRDKIEYKEMGLDGNGTDALQCAEQRNER